MYPARVGLGARGWMREVELYAVLLTPRLLQPPEASNKHPLPKNKTSPRIERETEYGNERGDRELNEIRIRDVQAIDTPNGHIKYPPLHKGFRRRKHRDIPGLVSHSPLAALQRATWRVHERERSSRCACRGGIHIGGCADWCRCGGNAGIAAAGVLHGVKCKYAGSAAHVQGIEQAGGCGVGCEAHQYSQSWFLSTQLGSFVSAADFRCFSSGCALPACRAILG
jgi:hypothetical protein